ncbi:hypothetical protein B566_EDAN018560 [Ephemera danica]|nr:hypothetical protein B566_EDAN018560 [Ephemera danica]
MDTNMDGKSDEIDFEIELQLGDEEDVYAVNLILLFDYRLNVTRLDVVGDLGLLQRSPLLPLRSINKRYNESVFGDPVSTRLQNEYSMWQPGRVRDEAFILSVRLRVPGQRIEYQPGFWQVVKWAWLQYVALLCIVKTVTDKIKHWAFTNHVMPVIRLPPPWAKAF